jgi:hypothetical protein
MTDTTTTEPTIVELESTLQKARECFERAATEASHASNRETDALNELNRAQKVFDAAVERARKAAPRESHWGCERRKEG